MEAYKYLINDYVAIIQSDRLLLPICEQLNQMGYTDITPAMIRKEQMISGGMDAVNTGVFTLTVSHTNKDLAYDLAAIIAEQAPALVTSIARPEFNTNTDEENTSLNCFEVLTTPVKATTYDSPSLITNVLIMGVVAAVVTYLAYLIYYLFNTRVATEEDIKNAFDLPVIGRIPRWEKAEKQ